MAKRQNFVVGSTNPNTETLTQTQLNNGWDRYQVLKSGVLDGIFNAVSDYSNDSSNEIANAIASITGSQPTGQSQSELAGALNQMRQDIETSSLTFKGYISDTAPSSSTYSLIQGDIWIDSATLPTSFPVAIAGVWDGTQWASTTDTYTVKNFDFFRNINDNEGYYWFGGEWVVMSTDMSTTYFTLNQTSGKWEIKSSVNLPGSPTTTSPDAADNSTKIATTEWVRNYAIPASSVMDTLYPVGSVYIGTQATCPLTTLIPGSTWSQIQGRYLLASGTLDGTTETYAAANTVGAGLPNITGSITADSGNGTATGAFSLTATDLEPNAGNWGSSLRTYQFSASSSSAVYGGSATNRPAAYVVNVWVRTA